MSNRQYLHNDPDEAAGKPPIEWPADAKAVEKKPAASNAGEAAENLARQGVDNAYAQPGPNPQPNQHTMRQQEYDWSAYHTAWQQYYHQYFYRYYANWMQQQNATQPKTDEEVTDELRQKIRTEVSKQTKRVKSSSHFKPLVAATSVALIFLFINYNQILIGAIKQYIAPGSTVTTPVIVAPGQEAVGPEPKVVIPKIGIDAPVVYDEPRVDEASFQKALERGAVRLGTTANPGTKGNVVIGGHSSNNVFNAGQFKYVFVNLRRLEVNDIVYLNYNGLRYTYKVTVKKVITPKDTSVLAQSAVPMVTLFTCDPPGRNVNRLIIQGVQIDPNPTGAVANTNAQPKVNSTNPLPSVAPSIWDWLLHRS